MPVPPRVVARLVAGGGAGHVATGSAARRGGEVFGVSWGLVFGVVMVVEVVRLLWLISERVM